MSTLHAIKILFFLFIFIYSVSSSSTESTKSKDANSDSRKPIYIIANMANNISEAEDFIADGANGLDIDVEFSLNGSPKSIHRGNPCFCSRDCSKRENIKDYLEFLQRSSVADTKHYNPRLSLVIFNLKTAPLSRGTMYLAGEKLADDVINYLYKKGKAVSRVWVILRLPDLRAVPLLRGFRDKFKSANLDWYLEKFGYSINHFPRPENLKAALLSSGITGHVWLGTGSANCRRRTTPQRVFRLSTERQFVDKYGDNFIDRIYSWIIDDAFNMRENLRLGVDAIITNKPNTLKTVLKEAEFESKMRLANIADVPWKWRTTKKKTRIQGKSIASSRKERLKEALSEIERELEDLDRDEDYGEGIRGFIHDILSPKNENFSEEDVIPLDEDDDVKEVDNNSDVDQLIEKLIHYIQSL